MCACLTLACMKTGAGIADTSSGATSSRSHRVALPVLPYRRVYLRIVGTGTPIQQVCGLTDVRVGHGMSTGRRIIQTRRQVVRSRPLCWVLRMLLTMKRHSVTTCGELHMTPVDAQEGPVARVMPPAAHLRAHSRLRPSTI